MMGYSSVGGLRRGWVILPWAGEGATWMKMIEWRSSDSEISQADQPAK